MLIKIEAALAALLLLTACGNDVDTTVTSTGTSTSSSSSTGGGGAPGKPEAGIPGCDARFIDADGICRPTIEKCDAGTIPRFDAGCVPVGIPGCAAAFVQADGLCHPAVSKCGAGTYPVPSEGCVAIDGGGCGTETFGLVTDQAGDQYVDPTYVGGASDGTRAKPWTSIAAALDAVAPEARVVLAAGTYAEPIEPAAPVEIVGRCASMVTVSGTTPSDGTVPAVVFANNLGGKLTLRGLRLSGAGAGVVVTNSSVDIDGVWVDQTSVVGISVKGATSTVSIHHSLVQDVGQDSDGTAGAGVDVFGGATATVIGSAIRGTHSWGVGAHGAGTKLEVTDSVVDGILPESKDGYYGYGILVNNGPTAQIDRVAAIRCAEGSFTSFGGGAFGVKDSLAEGGVGLYASGVQARATGSLGETVTVEGVAVLNLDGPGIYSSGGHVVASRTLVAHGRPSAQPESDGIYVGEGGVVGISDSALVDNEGIGVLAFTAGTQVIATGVLIERHRESSQPGLLTGQGIAIQQGASATLSRIASIENVMEGVAVAQLGPPWTLSESLISGTFATKADHVGGAGVYAQDTSFQIERTRVEKSIGAGIASIGSTGAITDVVVDTVDTGSLVILEPGTSPIVGIGDAIIVARGATTATTITRAWVTGAARAGIFYSSSQGEVSATTTLESLYGIALAGDPLPTLGADNAFTGTSKAVLENADLTSP